MIDLEMLERLLNRAKRAGRRDPDDEEEVGSSLPDRLREAFWVARELRRLEMEPVIAALESGLAKIIEARKRRTR